MLNITHFLQEFLISAFEERIIQEIELRIMRITYIELVTEDGEQMVTVAEEEAVEEIKTGGEKNKGVGFYTDSGYQNSCDWCK